MLTERLSKSSVTDEIIKRDYIIPLGLYNLINRFESLYKESEEEPILVVGDPGSGKTLILHIFKKLCDEMNKNKFEKYSKRRKK